MITVQMGFGGIPPKARGKSSPAKKTDASPKKAVAPMKTTKAKPAKKSEEEEDEEEEEEEDEEEEVVVEEEAVFIHDCHK